MNVDWARFCEIIQQANHIVLTSHIRPDCDALGSELGMAGVLRALGKTVRIVNGQETPDNLAFIDPENEIMCIHQDITPEELDGIDLHIILDTSAWVQLGPMADVIRNSKCKKIIFDHHEDEDDIDAEIFKNTSAEAVGRMVVEAAEHLGVDLTPEISVPLFAALSTDTGWFRFPSVSDFTYEIAAKLVRGGAIPADIYGDLYERESVGRVRLRGIVLSRIKVEIEGRLAHTHILMKDYEETGALPTDTEDLINLALKIDGTKFAVIMIEQVTGGFKISFRSRCGIACNEVAAHFGGGGHKAAAGAFIDAPFENVQSNVLQYVRRCMASEFSDSRA